MQNHTAGFQDLARQRQGPLTIIYALPLAAVKGVLKLVLPTAFPVSIVVIWYDVQKIAKCTYKSDLFLQSSAKQIGTAKRRQRRQKLRRIERLIFSNRRGIVAPIADFFIQASLYLDAFTESI